MSDKYEIRIDSADFSVLTSAFFTIAREMGYNMERTAKAPIYFSAHDFITAILSKDAEIVALAEYIPVMVGATPFAVRAVKNYFQDDIHDGDIFLLNDPYSLDGGNHLPDWSIIYPVFYEGELILWLVNKAHQQDTGGGVPGGYNANALDIYAEGLRIPPLRIYQNHKEIKDVVNFIMTNVRIPDIQYSDLLSLIGAARVASKRLHELIKNYGLDIIKLFLEDLLTYGEFLMKEEITKIKNGYYHSEITGIEGSSPINCDLIIKDDSITVDFSNSGPMSKEFINSSIANTYGATYQAILQSIGKNIEIRCGGCFRPIEVKTKPGTITHATHPATIGNCTNFIAKQIIESIWTALAQVAPKTTSAGWGSIPYWVISGIDPRRGEGYGSPDFMGTATGAGALYGVDGWSPGGPVICSGTLYYPQIEICESLYPIFWHQWEYAQDSAGPGKWRGGLGLHNKWEAKCGNEPMYLNYAADPFDYVPSPAIQKGQRPPENSKTLKLSNNEVIDKIKVRQQKFFVIHEGDIATDYQQGGCGVGDPFERDFEAVQKDVRDGIISLKSAKEDYGVLIDPETLEVDFTKSKDLRQKNKK